MQAGYYPTTVTPQRAPLGFDMNHLYLSPAQQQQSRPGIFLKRNEKIDWRRIAAVDVDRISRDMDFQVLQDNLEQITLCNIDAEIDSRAMDPNFVKLYKMAQLTIEYLLLCQDQITNQLVDYEQVKGKGFLEQEEARRQIDKLKSELFETKKESKKRRKMLETQQRMLMAQNSNYHTCPVCTHAFLSATYLQQHMHRRHPEYDPSRRREHDVDVEKESQRLKDELHKKDTELQLVKAQKALDEERIRERDTNIHQLKEEGKSLTAKIEILNDRLSHTRSNTHTQSSSPHRHEGDVSELLKENKSLRADIKQLKELLQEAETNLRKEEKAKRQYEKENQNLLRDISNLKENLQLLQNTSGDANRVTQELLSSRDKYNEEKSHRKRLQDELQEANNQLAHLRNQPPPVIDRKSPAPPPPRSAGSPIQTRPVQTTGILLPEHCPSLKRRLDENPKYLTKHRDEARKQFIEELEEYDNLGVLETDTRLGELDFRTKMERVLQTRRNIQDDLPQFERIRDDLSRKLDKLANERLDVQHSATSLRSAGSKLVTFKDERQRQRHTAPIYNNTTKSSTDQHRISTTVQSKSKHDHSRPTAVRTSTTFNESGEDVTLSNANESDDDEDTQPTRPGITTYIRPSPRKQAPPGRPTTGSSALVTKNIKPSTTTTSALVKHSITTKKSDSDSESESPRPPPRATTGTSVLVTKNIKPSTTTTSALVKPSITTKKSDSDSESESPRPPARPSTGVTSLVTKNIKPSTTTTSALVKPSITTKKSDSDSENESPRPPARPSIGVSSLVTKNIKPSTTSGASSTSALVRQPVVKPSITTHKSNSDSDSESPVPHRSKNGAYPQNVTEKTRIIEKKLNEANAKGQKPSVNAIAQGFQPSRQSLATHKDDDDDDDDSESLTTIHTANPPPRPSNGHLPQLSGRELVNNNHLSSGDVSQHTYDSLWKSQGGKGMEFRRPPTADSAKTSNMDSDDNLDGEESN